jgi:hypothetical protein
MESKDQNLEGEESQIYKTYNCRLDLVQMKSTDQCNSVNQEKTSFEYNT